MAFLPFKNDIFISYARLNDLVRHGHEKGWVTLFHEELEYQLSQRFERQGDIKIWRDTRELGGNTLFDDEIKESIKQSGLFLALTSDGYLSPESYCPQEIAWFCNKAKNERYGLRIGNRSRVINVLLRNIDHGKWLSEMKGMSGFSFNDATRQGEIGHTLQFGTTPYNERMTALVDQLETTIREFETSAAVTSSLDKSKRTPGSFKVFLAYTEGSLTVKRDRLAQKLEQEGLEVVTNIPPPSPAALHEEAVTKELVNTGLSIHMFDEGPGHRIEGLPSETYYRKQFELGVQSGIRQLVCVPKTLEVDGDTEHGRFMHELENGSRSEANYRFLRQHEPALITQDVLQEIEMILKARKTSAAQLAALIDIHEKDEVFAPELSRVFLKRQQRLLINPASDEPEESIAMFEELRSGLSVLILVLGYVSDTWVSRRLNFCLQLAVSSLKFCGIYAPSIDGSPRSINPRIFQIPHVNFPVAICFSPQSLAGLLDEFV